MKSSANLVKTADNRPPIQPKTHYYQVAVNKPSRTLFQFYTYSCQTVLQPGVVVRVKFGGKLITGVIIHEAKRLPITQDRILPISSVLSENAYFSPEALHFARQISRHYLVSIGEVLAAMLFNNQIIKNANISLRWPTSRNQPQLIYGRFSERINHYVQLIEPILSAKGQVTIITSTQNQAVNIFQSLQELFGHNKIVLIDHDTPSNDKYRDYNRILNQSAQIIIGTRKLFFLPIPNLKHIIIEQPGQYGYFNDQKPAYFLSDIALLLADTKGLNLTFGDTSVTAQLAKRISQHQIRVTPLSPPQAKIIESTGSMTRAIDQLSGQLKIIVVPFKNDITSKSEISADTQSVARYLDSQKENYIVVSSDTEFANLPSIRPLTIVATSKIITFPNIVFNDALILRADHWLTLPNYDNEFRLVELWQTLRFNSSNYVYLHSHTPLSEIIKSPLATASVINQALLSLKKNLLPPYSLAVHITPKKDLASITPLLSSAISTQVINDTIIAFYDLSDWPPKNPDDWLKLARKIVINPPN